MVDAGRGPEWGGRGAGSHPPDSRRRLCPPGSSGLGRTAAAEGPETPAGFSGSSILRSQCGTSARGRPGGLASQTGACGFQERRPLCQAEHRPSPHAPSRPATGRGCLLQPGGSREPAGGREEGSLSKSPESRHHPFCFEKQGRISCRWEGKEGGGSREEG